LGARAWNGVTGVPENVSVSIDFGVEVAVFLARVGNAWAVVEIVGDTVFINIVDGPPEPAAVPFGVCRSVMLLGDEAHLRMATYFAH
jgi:hypothetical protein